MEIEAGLVAYLKSHSVVAPLVGNGDRIYPGKIPEHAYDEATKLNALVYQRVQTMRQVTTCGTADLVECIVQIDCYTRSYKQTKSLAAALRNAMIDYVGLMGDIPVDNVQMEGEMDLPDEEPGLLRVMHTYRIWFTEQ